MQLAALVYKLVTTWRPNVVRALAAALDYAVVRSHVRRRSSLSSPDTRFARAELDAV
jgi:hypothetical protein